MSDTVAPATPHSGLEYVNGNVSQFPLWPQYTEQNTIYEQLHPSFSYLFAALFFIAIGLCPNLVQLHQHFIVCSQ